MYLNTFKEEKDFGCFNLKDDFNFKYISTFNISEIFNHLKTLDSKWLEIKKDDISYSTYKEALSIPIIVRATKGSDNLIVIRSMIDEKLEILTNPIINYLEDLNDGTVTQATFLKLLTSKKILPLANRSLMARVTNKYHIVIEGDEKAFLRIDTEHQNMKPGECWEINDNKKHSTWNLSELDRIDLIIDILPKKLI